MDQIKDILRQIARYRFWIAVCVAAMLSAGAYVLGSGPVQKKTADETGKITSAYKDVQQYASSSVPTGDFAPIVEQKTAVLTKDVDAAWKQLYDRQAPLLTWPPSVSERFKAWGRKWPEDAAPSAVQLAIVDYVEAYPAYVDQVFKVFRPFDYETGEGVVASAPKEQLLRPVTFDLNTKAPKLGEVWSAQERLWVQRTALEVIAQVNRNAKDWDSAYVKEIKLLEVGSALAQDQRSLAKGEELEEAEAIRAPNEPEEEEEGMGEMGGMMGSSMMGSGMMGSAMMGRMGGMGSGMGGAAGAMTEAQSVLFLKPENATQYKILPIMFTVLVDQDHVQNLLVELENSPMAIEVRDFEMLRPTEKVVKPEKGEQFMGGYGMMGMMGMMGGPGGMMGGRGRMGYGGMMSGRMGGMGGMPGMEGGMMGMMGPGGMMGGGMGMAPTRQGVDKRGENRAEKRKEAEKALESTKPVLNFDPYFNIVEVTVYGQARFYNEPTPEAVDAESPGATDADAADPAAAEEPKAEAPAAESAKVEEPKAEAPAAEPAKAEEPKAEAAPAEPAKTEEPKAEAPPAEEPKAEAPQS
ncbi:hypothetical protein [Planctomyces sp. SH-PL62]|uniref:hypothetical protein n=1 Tax=Planctomyces sp. SH-PL62 TaxID=1636152 RepID=UPI00078B25B0|nr:hypothetical protein [Planctomyces sp. SH-PL62]AMV37655.1 hypothetical protein VT85_09480 [Planctomyces sp. SH-PL62]